MAFLSSCSPPSIFLTSPASISAARASEGGHEVLLDRLALADPVDEDAEVLRLRSQGLGEVAVVLQPPAAPQHLLRPVRIAPEVGGGGAGLEFAQLPVGARECQR